MPTLSRVHTDKDHDDTTVGITIGRNNTVDPTIEEGIIIGDGGGGLSNCSKAIILAPSGPTLCDSTASLTSSVIIGHQCFKAATAASSIIDCVAIGSTTCADTVLQSGTLRDVVAIGHNSGRAITQTAKQGTFVGSYSCDTSNSSSITHSVSDGVVCVGYKSGQLTSATQSIGSDAILIGTSCGSSDSSSANIPADSILIGRHAVCDNSTLEGQIIIGSTHHNTTRIAGLLLDISGHSAAGHGNSYHISGAGASEKRGIIIHPCNVETDSGTASLMVDHAGGGSAIEDPASVADSRRRFSLGCRPEADSMQMYFPIVVPSLWKATAILVYITQGNTNAQMSVQISVASRKIVNISQGSSTSNYITSHLPLSSSNTSNSLRTFATAYTQTPSNPTNCYLYVASQSEHTIVTGGYVQIERV